MNSRGNGRLLHSRPSRCPLRRIKPLRRGLAVAAKRRGGGASTAPPTDSHGDNAAAVLGDGRTNPREINALNFLAPHLSEAPAAPVSLCHGREKRDEPRRTDASDRRGAGGPARGGRRGGQGRQGRPHPAGADPADRRRRPDRAAAVRGAEGGRPPQGGPGPRPAAGQRRGRRRLGRPDPGPQGPGRLSARQREPGRRPSGDGNG